VSYLNTIPLLFGIRNSKLIGEIDLLIDYPSRIASFLLEDKIDIGLVPVAVIPKMKEFYLNTQYCIGSEGPVASVCLFSERPIQNVKTVLMDYQSTTSVELTKILLREYWKIEPDLLDTREDFRHLIGKETAGLIIGDRALEQRKISSYIYDLGEAWKNLTNLPFVFAAWISNKKLDESFVQEFDTANSIGLKDLERVLESLHSDLFDLKEYYTKYISYNFDEAKMKALNLFLDKINPK